MISLNSIFLTSLFSFQVHIVRDCPTGRGTRPTGSASRLSRLPPRLFLTPRRILAALSGKPADDPPPTIVIVRNTTLNTVIQNSDLNNPSTVLNIVSQNSDSNPSTSQTVPKLPLPEQWMHKRPIDYKYTTIPRPLAQLKTDLGADLTLESRAKKYSATRSPSLEKDDKSPFLNSAKSDKEKEVFGFDTEIVRRLSEKEETMMSPKESADNCQDSSPGNLRRFRSVSTKLHMCIVNDNQTERLEMQSSPRVLECSSAKEKSSVPKFDFSPKLLDTMVSPRFFTPPETVSPMFFNEPSPRSVYFDTVRSPKFFPETPRDNDVPQSPRTLGDHVNRNGIEKPSSPRILSARPSPKLLSYNKENYFTFDHSKTLPEESTRASPSPRKYGGRNSIERERFTPPADKDIRKYRRHNSCDTYKTVEVNISAVEDNKTSEDKDVVDCCVKIESIVIENKDEKLNELNPNSVQARRQRLKSISLDSDNAKIIEQNLGLPIAKQMKDQMNEAYKNESTSCESIERYQKTPTKERPCFMFDDEPKPIEVQNEEEPESPGLLQKKCLRQSSDTQAFIDMPRFSPKEFEITVTTEEGATVPVETQKPKTKNLRNLTIDLSKRDSDLEKELLEFEKLYTNAEEKKVKTPTLKVKATSLDSSESVNLSLPQKKALDVPQNSVSVPNTPKRQLKRILPQKNVKHDFCGAKLGFTQNAEQRRLFMKGQDSGIYLREHHANLMLYQPGTSRMGSRTMGSFDENTTDYDSPPEINICGADNRTTYDSGQCGQSLGSNLLNYKQNLSVSSTNLKTLPEGVPSDDFETSAEEEKVVKKLHRRNSNQSLMLSTHSLQSSNCSLNSSGTSCHNIATVRTSISNFSLNDNRKKLSLDRRDSNVSLINTEHLTPTTRVICSSNASLSGEGSKNCLLQRRGSNNSLTLNICSTNLSRHGSCSNSSLNKDAKLGQKKGLLERRSSNTSLTLNINNSNPQLSVNQGLSVSNYNLNGSSCNLSRYNSNHSIDNAQPAPRKGILERRSSNTSLTLNIPQEPREVEIDETLLDQNLKDLPHKDKHRKSLSTENLIPKSYKNRLRLRSTEKGFGSHDNLWSTSYTEPEYPQNLTCVGGDQENEIIYAFGRQEDTNFQPGFTRNITTKPLSPQSTSEDFRLYLANMQHLQNATSVLTRQQLKDLNNVFQNGYSKVKCHSSTEGAHCCAGTVEENTENPQMVIPEITSQPCSEYQKKLLRNLHQEFWDMPTNFQEKPIVSGSHTKNRYKTILPNEHSRFILRADVGTTEGYINANFIKVTIHFCIFY